MEQFGQYFRPAGVSARTGDPVKASTPTPAPAAAPVTETAPAEAVAEAPATTTESTTAPADNNKAEDILAMIRNRNQ